MTRAYTETRKLVITSTTDSIDGVGALTISSGGENTNVNLAPTGEGTVDVNSKKITRLAAPTSDSDAATKAYVDATKQGLDVKDSVRVSTTANITLSGTQSVDGVNVIAGDRVLVKNQTTGSENGIYVVAAGAWTRAVDANSDADVTSGMFTFVEEGTSNGDSGYVMTTNAPITLGTTALVFTQFSGAGQVGAGNGLTKTGNTLDVVGTADRITVNADSVDIASTYAGQSSITTLGTVATGTWQATAVAVAYGGTGATTAGGAASNLGLGTEDSPSFTAVTLSANTVSSDTTSGALVVTGGVGVGGAMNIGGALDVNAAASANSMSVTDATASTSTSTGAMVVTGGVGVGGAMNVGGALDVNAAASVNSMSVTDATASTSTSTGAMVVTGGVGVGGAMNIGGATKVTDSTASTSTSTGALVVTGGVGVGGDLHVSSTLIVNGVTTLQVASVGGQPGADVGFSVRNDGESVGFQVKCSGQTSISSADASTSTSTGALVVTGGVGVGGAMNVGGALDVNAAASVNSMSVTDATASTSTSTGAMVVTGGVGVGGAMNIGGATKVTDSTASTSTSTGAMVVTGGVGVGGAMNIGGATKVADNTASTSTSTGAMVVTGGVGVGGTIYATQVNAGNIQAVTNTISATNADGSIFLAPLGTGTVDVSSKRITNLASPSGDNDAATKAYVDAVKQGLDVKDSVRVATTANITLSGTQSVDGVNVIAGDRVLVKNQTTGSENGIYVVAAGAWTRAVDANSDADVTSGMFTFVEEGTSNGDSGYVMTTNAPITLGTTALVFTQFSGAGQVGAGNGLTKTGNTLDVVGTADRITVNADSVDIASTYAGQSSITTLGTVGTGTWQATTVAVEYGGTGATTGGDARTNLGIGEADIVSFGSVSLSDATASTNTSTGAMVVTGGVGIGGAMNIGGAVDVNSSLTANSMSVDGNFNTGVTLGTNAFPTGKISVRSAIVDLKTVADTTIFTVPTGYMFLVDTMEIVTTSVTSPSAAPVVQFGNGGDGDAYYGPNQVTSNSVGARHIIENPQDGVVAGTAVAFGVTTASTASAHSGVGIVTGYLMKTA